MDNSIDFAPDYDPKEFAPLSLLERGDVDVWVRRRGAFLLDKSKEIAKDCEASKLASALTIGASVVMSSNPLAWLPLTLGALGYVYTVFQEFQDTGSIRIIPMYRGKLGDIICIMEGGLATQRHPLEDQIEYLSEAEKDEALLVNYRFGEIASILNSAPPKVRFDLYRHICGQFHARRDILTLDEVKHYISSAVSEERRTAMPPQLQPTIDTGDMKAMAPTQPLEPTVSSCPTHDQPPITNNSQPITQSSPDNPASEQAGHKVLDALATTRRSTLLIGDTGAGKSVWIFAKQQGDWVTVRDIQRKDFATLKGKGSQQIHQYLGLLSDSEYGEIDEEGKSHSSVRFKAH